MRDFLIRVAIAIRFVFTGRMSLARIPAMSQMPTERGELWLARIAGLLTSILAEDEQFFIIFWSESGEHMPSCQKACCNEHVAENLEAALDGVRERLANERGERWDAE